MIQPFLVQADMVVDYSYGLPWGAIGRVVQRQRRRNTDRGIDYDVLSVGQGEMNSVMNADAGDASPDALHGLLELAEEIQRSDRMALTSHNL